MNNQFKLGKCMTRGGEEVRIVDIDPTSPKHLVITAKDDEEATCYLADGRYSPITETSRDLLPNNTEVVRVRLYRVVGYAPELVAECNWQYYDANKNFSQCSDTIEIPVRQSE